MDFVKFYAGKLKATIGLLPVLLLMGIIFISASLPASAETINIDANSVYFEPAQAEVRPGDVIHFEIKKSPPHNVVFDSRGPSNLSRLSHKAMEMSGGFDITIPKDTKPGTYQYWCDPHQGVGMLGRIIIKG
ncbi:MAG: plastocyanin/azurin family copper-binding protein [Cyanobacteria bacterium P01_F01_bin.150]